MKIEKGQKYLCTADYYLLNNCMWHKGKIYEAVADDLLRGEISTYCSTKDLTIFQPLSSAKWAIKLVSREITDYISSGKLWRYGDMVFQKGITDRKCFTSGGEYVEDLEDGYTEIDFETFKEITGVREEKREFIEDDWVIGWHRISSNQDYHSKPWLLGQIQDGYAYVKDSEHNTRIGNIRHATPEEIASVTQPKIFTIEDVRNGRCAIENDGTVEELNKVLKAAFPNDKQASIGTGKMYARSIYNENGWNNDQLLDLPTQSVKIFLSQIEEKTPIQKAIEKLGQVRVKEIIDEVAAKQPTEEWQPKWGEGVECSGNNEVWVKQIFISKSPDIEGDYICYDKGQSRPFIWKLIRQPIHTFTAEQAKQDLAKLHNLNPEQIKIKD